MTEAEEIKLMQNKPRINKTKEEILSDMKSKAKVEHIKEVVRKVFPLLEPLDTIYDAQTALMAIQGFINADIEEKINAFKMSDIQIDLSKEKDSKIKTQMLALIDLMKDEPAKDLSTYLERLSRAFSDYGSTQFVKGKMETLKIEDILAN